MMRKLITFILFTIWFSISKAEEIVIIANKSISINHISKREVKLIYLKKKFFIKGTKVVPVNLHPFNPLRKKFNRYILNMDEEQLSLYWNEMYFNGIDPPIVLSSQRAIVEFVSKVKGAIGYISPRYVNNKVKILLRVKINGKKSSDSRR